MRILTELLYHIIYLLSYQLHKYEIQSIFLHSLVLKSYLTNDLNFFALK